MATQKQAAGTGRKRPEIVYDGDEGLIAREGDLIELTQFGPWTARHTELAREYKVNALNISEVNTDEWPNLEFLLDLPPLRSLHVVLWRPKDLTPVTRLLRLEYLGLMGGGVASSPAGAADFSKLKKLKTAVVQMGPTTASILKCGPLERLRVWDSDDQELDLGALPALQVLGLARCAAIRDLDLTGQPALEELHLEACPKLRSVALHPKARLRRLKISNTGPYRIDWARMGPDLELLEVAGPPRWSLEDVLKAPNLKKLSTNGIRKFPPLKVLLGLKHLQDFTYFAPPPGPKFSDDDREIIRAINARGQGKPQPALSRWSMMSM